MSWLDAWVTVLCVVVLIMVIVAQDLHEEETTVIDPHDGQDVPAQIMNSPSNDSGLIRCEVITKRTASIAY